MGSTWSESICCQERCLEKGSDQAAVIEQVQARRRHTSPEPRKQALQIARPLSKAATAYRQRAIAAPCHFPTYALPMQSFLGLPRMQPHEQVLEDLVIPEHREVVHFISHEWLGFDHPDSSDNKQLQLMQTIFTKFMHGQAASLFRPDDWDAFLQGVSTGSASVVRPLEGQLIDREAYQEHDLPAHVLNGTVWLDYHSIPQDTERDCFVDAVKSIPHYVERCDYFWICAPPSLHRDLHEPRDFYTWKGRGWCRLEEMTNLLSTTLKMPLIVTNENHLETYGFLDALASLIFRPDRSVANGKFTCCHFQHRIRAKDGSWRDIKCDKDAVAPVILSVFESLYAHTSGDSDAAKCRFLTMVAPSIFAGFEDRGASQASWWSAPDSDDLELFLERAGYESIDAKDSMGWAPMTYAVLQASMQVVRKLHEARPEMIFVRPVQKATVISMAVHRPAAEFREFLALHPRLQSVEELNQLSVRGYSAVDRAAKFGMHDSLRYMLELRADVDPRRLDNGASPLLSAAAEGYALCCEVLLEHRADIEARDKHGRTALHLATQFLAPFGNAEPGGRARVVEVLVAANADPCAEDDAGWTPLQVAVESGFSAAVDILSATTPD